MEPASIPSLDTAASSDSPPGCPASRLFGSPVHLRTIECLRSGLPPTEAVLDISINCDKAVRTIRDLLNRRERDARWMMVRGQYGAGKTHLLHLFRSLAHDLGFATSYLCADGFANALNHPQRFFPSLMGTLEIPGAPGLGYDHLIRRLLGSDAGRSWILDESRKVMTGWREPFCSIVSGVAALQRLASHDGIAGSQALVSRIVDDLFGRTISHRPATPLNREIVYQLLVLASRALEQSHFRGLAVLIDEAESIFTKLPTSRSRLGAMRVLSAICRSAEFGQLVTVIAMTPDADQQMKEEARGQEPTGCHRRYEPMQRFLSEVKDSERRTLSCFLPGPTDARALIEKIRDLYFLAYPACMRFNGQDAEQWSRYLDKASRSPLSTRLLVRQVVDFLDSQRMALVLRS